MKLSNLYSKSSDESVRVIHSSRVYMLGMPASKFNLNLHGFLLYFVVTGIYLQILNVLRQSEILAQTSLYQDY